MPRARSNHQLAPGEAISLLRKAIEHGDWYAIYPDASDEAAAEWARSSLQLLDSTAGVTLRTRGEFKRVTDYIRNAGLSRAAGEADVVNADARMKAAKDGVAILKTQLEIFDAMVPPSGDEPTRDTGMQRDAACLSRLRRLLQAMFSHDEFKRLLEGLEGGEELLRSLPIGSVSEEEYFARAVGAMVRRDLIDGGFFVRLCEIRPRRAQEIRAVADNWA